MSNHHYHPITTIHAPILYAHGHKFDKINTQYLQLNNPHAIIDSGTTNLLLPTIVYFKVLAAIESFSYVAANGSKVGFVNKSSIQFSNRDCFYALLFLQVLLK